LRGPVGYGHDSRLLAAKILRLSHDLPCVVEIIDARAAVDRYVEAIRPIIGTELVTVETVEILNGGSKLPEDALRRGVASGRRC
jgi:PII-like signaling protein